LIIITLILHFKAMSFAWNNGKKHYKDKLIHVYDIIHSNFNERTKYNYTKNLYLLLFICPIIFNLNKFNRIIINEFIINFCLIIILRSMMIICTILPRQKNCRVEKLKIFDKTIGGTCYDKMFSGHFAFGLIISILLLKNNIISNNNTNKILFFIINFIHFFIISVTRSHYTIDIVVSLFMTLFVFIIVKDKYLDWLIQANINY
jgi:hypothetical protein